MNSPVNARAVKASDYDATQKFIASLTNAYDKTFVNNYLDRTETPDDRTIVVHLKKPLFYLFGMSAWWWVALALFGVLRFYRRVVRESCSCGRDFHIYPGT